MSVPRAGPAEQFTTVLTRDLLNLEMHVLDVTLKGLSPYAAGPAKYPGADVTLYCVCVSWRRVLIFEHQMAVLIEFQDLFLKRKFAVATTCTRRFSTDLLSNAKNEHTRN